MTTFDDREDKYENRFAHDAAVRFRAEAKRNRMLGEWAAGLLGKTGDAVEEYVREVIRSDLEEAGDEDVFRKIRADFDTAGVSRSDHQIRRSMDEFMENAIRQVSEEE